MYSLFIFNIICIHKYLFTYQYFVSGTKKTNREFSLLIHLLHSRHLKVEIASLATVSQLISTCHPLDQHMSAGWSVRISYLINTCQSIDHHLSSARSAPTLLHEQSLLSHAVSDAQPVDLLLSGAWSFPALLVIQHLVNHWISVSQPLDHCSLSRLKSAYAAER